MAGAPQAAFPLEIRQCRGYASRMRTPPLLAAGALLLLAVLARADDGLSVKTGHLKMPKRSAEDRKKPKCLPYEPLAFKDHSPQHVQELLKEYLAGSQNVWQSEFKSSKELRGSPVDTVGPKANGNQTDGYMVRLTELLVDPYVIHDDEEQLRCIMAHESVHVRKGHAVLKKPVFEQAAARCRQKYTKDELKKAIVDRFGGCSESKVVGANGETECALLEKGVLEDCVERDPDYSAIRRKHELEADEEAVPAMIKSGHNPWGCWALVKQMREAKPDPSEPPDVHPAPHERAALYEAQLKANPDVFPVCTDQ